MWDLKQIFKQLDRESEKAHRVNQIELLKQIRNQERINPRNLL